MKLSAQFTFAAAIATAAAAHQHGHAHLHQHHQRDTVIVNDVEVKYIYDGSEVSYSQMCQGLANGTFEWDSTAGTKPSCDVNAPSSAVPTSTTSSEAIPTASAAAFLQESASKSSSSSVSAPSASASVQLSSTNSDFMSLLANNPGVTQDFPDGQLPCTFSSLQEYGAVPLNYLGLGGFTAIVSANIVDEVINSLNMLSSGSGQEGAYYSYSCPVGYMKVQWPSQNSGQTVGGVLCENGVFKLTNPSFKTLCGSGAGSVQLINNIDKVISVCNTDYPSTESETIPAQVNAGGTSKVAITDSATYFRHQGSTTSAQYYLNMAGYGIESACTWGTNDGKGIGNWAPVNLGLGTDSAGEMVYVGLLSAEQVLHDPASPGTPINLNYNVKVSSSASSQVCSYDSSSGQFSMSGQVMGTLGQTFDGKGTPGATCAYPVGSDIQVTFS